LEEGLYYSAFELYEQIRSTGFEDATAERGLARIWDEWSHYSLAKQHAERALALDPQSAEALELLGKIHLHGNEPQAAVSAFLEALARTPENPSLHSTIGSVLLKLGNSGEARGYLEKAVALDPALIEARNDLAEALARLGDDDGALHEFAVANPPAAAFNKLGLVYLADRKWEKAQNAFKQALVHDSDHFKARLNLSVAQSYLPHPTIINLPPLDVARSAQQAYGIENSGIETRPDQDTRTPLIAEAKTAGTEDVEDNRQERNPASPSPQPILSRASAHLPTTTRVYLPPFEESDPTPFSPDLVPTSIGTEEQQVSEPKLAFQDLPNGWELSPGLDPIQLQTLSQPDTLDGDQKEPIDELLDDYEILLAGPFFQKTLVSAFPRDDPGAPPHLPTTTIVHLPAFEESTPTPYRPDLDPTSIDQEEQRVLALKPTLVDLPISSQPSPTLYNTTVLTLSQPDTVVGEQKERIDELLDDHKILLAGPFFERSLVSAEHLTQSNTEMHPSSVGRIAEEISFFHPIGKGAPRVPRTALATPAQFSSLGRHPYLNSAVFLLNPISAGRDGQIGAKVLLSSFNPFGLGEFDIRDFMVPFRETRHQQEAPWESLSLLGPRDSLNDPFEVVLSGIGLGVLLFLMLGWPIGVIIGGLMRHRT
jgi:Flp pilus assembly protein TadD